MATKNIAKKYFKVYLEGHFIFLGLSKGMFFENFLYFSTSVLRNIGEFTATSFDIISLSSINLQYKSIYQKEQKYV